MSTGYATYPGIAKLIGGQFTFNGHGTIPSAAAIEIHPQATFPAPRGTLAFVFGDTVIPFPDCKLNAVSAGRQAGGAPTWTLQIQDRRVWWTERAISGQYNLRHADDVTVDTDTEKTPQELAVLLLEAMGEQGYDVASLPNDTRPLVRWTYASAARELDTLCESLGCRVVLCLDNVVRICRLGEGAELPGGQLIDDAGTIDPPEVPDALRVVFSETRVQGLLGLRPVGLDTDGQIKQIASLSYTPTGGWGSTIPGRFLNLSNTDPTGAGNQSNSPRALATRTVWRWYQAFEITDAAFGQKINALLGNEFEFVFDRMDQILPILPDLVDIDTATGKPFTPTVQGVFRLNNGLNTNSPVWTEYTRPFTINADLGIVEFSDYVFKWSTSGSFTSTLAAADIYLLCAFMLEHHQTREAHRVFRRLALGGANGTGDKIIRVEEVGGTLRANYNAAGAITTFTDNTADLEQEADQQLAAAAAEFQVGNPQDRTYPGFVPIGPDGAIQSVSYSFKVGRWCSTRASRNNEWNVVLRSYAERRRQVEVRRQRAAVLAREAARRERTRGWRYIR